MSEEGGPLDFVLKIFRDADDDEESEDTRLTEGYDLDIGIGDVILTGRFKNKRTVVKDIGVDNLGQLTINGMKALNFRIEKLMPKSKWSKESLDKETADAGDT